MFDKDGEQKNHFGIDLQLHADKDDRNNDPGAEDPAPGDDNFQGFINAMEADFGEPAAEGNEDEGGGGEPEPDAKEGDPETGDPEPPNKEEGAYYTKAQIDEMMQKTADGVLARERARRDKETRQGQEQQQQQQRQADFEKWYNQTAQAKMQRYVDMGIEEETAKRYAIQDMEEAVERRSVNERIEDMQRQTVASQKRAEYAEAKNRIMQENPILAKYAKEIDEASEHGNVPFDVAARYVMGDLLLSGELLPSVRAQTQQQTQYNIEKRGKTRVEQRSQSGANSAPEADLTQVEINMARQWGFTPKEYARLKKG